MSEFCIIKCEIDRRYASEDNKYDTIIESKIKTQQKEEQIIKEIIERKIPVTSKMISNKIIHYMSKRCHSPTYIGKIIDLSDVYNEKIKFDEWIKYNKELHQKIEINILNLLIDIFNKRYKLYPNNMCGLSPFASQCKKNIELFCPKYYEISIYLLYVLNKQFIHFCKYLDEIINFKNINNVIYENIKEILYYVGKDLKKIFKRALEEIENFQFTSILILILEEYLTRNKKKEEKKIKNIALYKEKQIFDNTIKTVHNLYFQKEYEIELIKKIKFENEVEINDINNNNENKKEKKENNNIEDNNIDKKEKKINEDKNNNGPMQNLNIDDLINYINEPKTNDNNNKKKKKKKKKKDKKGVQKVEIVDEDKDNINLDEDIDIINYKKSLEEFSESVSDTKKIKPQYSEQFLKRLQML